MPLDDIDWDDDLVHVHLSSRQVYLGMLSAYSDLFAWRQLPGHGHPIMHDYASDPVTLFEMLLVDVERTVASRRIALDQGWFAYRSHVERKS